MASMIDIVKDFMRQRFDCEPIVLGNNQTYYTCTCFAEYYCVTAIIHYNGVQFDVIPKEALDNIVTEVFQEKIDDLLDTLGLKDDNNDDKEPKP